MNTFNTIIGDDWKRQLADARAQPNVAHEQIKTALQRGERGGSALVNHRGMGHQHRPAALPFRSEPAASAPNEGPGSANGASTNERKARPAPPTFLNTGSLPADGAAGDRLRYYAKAEAGVEDALSKLKLSGDAFAQDILEELVDTIRKETIAAFTGTQ